MKTSSDTKTGKSRGSRSKCERVRWIMNVRREKKAGRRD